MLDHSVCNGADDDANVWRFAREGRNCGQIATANRLAFIIDTEAYFRHFKSAALAAQHSIWIIGWDVNSQTLLEFAETARPDVPNQLGPFLDYLAQRQARLHIRVLDWDSPLLFAPDREWAQRARFDWFTNRRLCFALDAQHPLGASHHQKLAVIDDCIAFVGGIDLTDSRLDGVEHRADDPRRQTPDGSPYGPYHDVQVAVDGAAAEALAGLARQRWMFATGERVPPPPSASDCSRADRWPEAMAVDVRDGAVAISRTCPAWKSRKEVREIEAMYIDAIAHAKTSVYIENQYFCAERIARAIAERLAEDDGPEFVLVIPPTSSGWLERATMGSKQQRLLRAMYGAGQPSRFRVYGPVVGETGDVAIKVHSKLLIVDGRFITVGSANLNNRSFGLDTECNLSLEGKPGSAEETAITSLRDRLLAEHLDVDPATVSSEIATTGSVIAAIETLRHGGRSLRPLSDSAPELLDRFTADLDLLDPAAPALPEQIAHTLLGDRLGRTTLRGAIIRLAAILALLLALAALWHWGPLAEWTDPTRLQALSRVVDNRWAAIGAVLAAYVVGGLLMFPVMVLIVATGLLFEPVTGLGVAAAGAILSATTGYGAGMIVGRRLLGQLLRGGLSRISRKLARRGILAMAVIRMLPVAPFTLINLAAGASRIRFRDYILGTIIGMAPGIAAITLFSGQLWRVIHAPNAVNIVLLIALLLLIAGAIIFCWRHFLRRLPAAFDA